MTVFHAVLVPILHLIKFVIIANHVVCTIPSCTHNHNTESAERLLQFHFLNGCDPNLLQKESYEQRNRHFPTLPELNESEQRFVVGQGPTPNLCGLL